MSVGEVRGEERRGEGRREIKGALLYSFSYTIPF